MSDTTALDAAKIDIRRWTHEERGARGPYAPVVIFTPSVLAEATELLAKLYAAGQEHHIDREDWAAVTSLPTGVLDALTARYCSRVALTHIEYDAVRDRLVGELGARHLTVERGLRVTVAPLPGGPSWGNSGRSGLSLGLTVGGWDIRVDEVASSPRPIAAHATEDGAREVAELVHKILSGEAPNPFAALAAKEASA
ncbi:hypothetical protein [Streptomyces olivaceus]|uniref:hypothetical protein n=1 Tax=Streptomyces olivaceus TaxID=47716 RepID=UPI0022EF5E0A|nr:hypothetical protein [Streptomyces olivaceus]GHI98125.1 hypothetical protein TPA0905_75960 [Streptomyces olivaceus]